MLTVGELISLLRAYPSDAEIRIAHQPQWPFAYQISGVTSDDEIRNLCDQTWRNGQSPHVWLVEGALEGTIKNSVWRTLVRKRGS